MAHSVSSPTCLTRGPCSRDSSAKQEAGSWPSASSTVARVPGVWPWALARQISDFSKQSFLGSGISLPSATSTRRTGTCLFARARTCGPSLPVAATTRGSWPALVPHARPGGGGPAGVRGRPASVIASGRGASWRPAGHPAYRPTDCCPSVLLGAVLVRPSAIRRRRPCLRAQGPDVAAAFRMGPGQPAHGRHLCLVGRRRDRVRRRVNLGLLARRAASRSSIPARGSHDRTNPEKSGGRTGVVRGGPGLTGRVATTAGYATRRAMDRGQIAYEAFCLCVLAPGA